MKIIDFIALILVFIGGVNWGLIGSLDFNLVDLLFCSSPILTNTAYIMVGIAAIYVLIRYFAYYCCKK